MSTKTKAAPTAKGTKIATCSCRHEAQDAEHGPYKRVHNLTAKASKPGTHIYRCTICKNEKEL